MSTQSPVKNSRCVGKYELRDVLGTGTSSTVWSATNTATGEPVAVKILNKQHLVSTCTVKNVVAEVEILQRISLPHVIRLLEVLQSQRKIYLIFEHCPCGDVFDIIERGPMSEDEARTLFLQLIEGLSSLHAKHIAHRDIKPENLMVAADGGLKIGDFGCAKQLTSTSSIVHSCVGTPQYMAPEVAVGPYDAFAADVWSCGCVLYVMTSGQMAFHGRTNTEVFESVSSGQFLPSPLWSAALHDLIARMLTVDPSQRPSLQDVRDHPWFRGSSTARSLFPSEDQQSVAKDNTEQLAQPTILVDDQPLKTTDFSPMRVSAGPTRQSGLDSSLVLSGFSSPARTTTASGLIASVVPPVSTPTDDSSTDHIEVPLGSRNPSVTADILSEAAKMLKKRVAPPMLITTTTTTTTTVTTTNVTTVTTRALRPLSVIVCLPDQKKASVAAQILRDEFAITVQLVSDGLQLVTTMFPRGGGSAPPPPALFEQFQFGDAGSCASSPRHGMSCASSPRHGGYPDVDSCASSPRGGMMRSVSQYDPGHQYDLVLTDTNITPMTGLMAASTIRRMEARNHRQPVPIVAFSDGLTGAEADECVAAGVSLVLTKPGVSFRQQVEEVAKSLATTTCTTTSSTTAKTPPVVAVRSSSPSSPSACWSPLSPFRSTWRADDELARSRICSVDIPTEAGFFYPVPPSGCGSGASSPRGNSPSSSSKTRSKGPGPMGPPSPPLPASASHDQFLDSLSTISVSSPTPRLCAGSPLPPRHPARRHAARPPPPVLIQPLRVVRDRSSLPDLFDPATQKPPAPVLLRNQSQDLGISKPSSKTTSSFLDSNRRGSEQSVLSVLSTT